MKDSTMRMPLFKKQLFFALFVYVSVLLAPSVLHADTTFHSERTSATLVSDFSTIKAGQSFTLALHLEMQPGWHTYWKNPGESGTAPHLEWTLPGGFTQKPLQYPAPDVLQTGELVDYGYAGDAWLLTETTAPAVMADNVTSIIMLKASWLACKDVCIPETAEFALTLPSGAQPVASEAAPVIAHNRQLLPAGSPQNATYSVSGDRLELEIPLPDLDGIAIKAARFFPDTEGFIANTPNQNVAFTKDTLRFTLQKTEDAPPAMTTGLVSLFLENNDRKDFTVSVQSAGVPATPVTEEQVGYSALISFIALAFFGGMLLNLMPCVFPVLSLKAFAIARKAEKHPEIVRKHGIAYSAGVILSFILLALVLIAIQSGGQSFGWGYQMQSPAFVTALLILLFLVGLNLSGYFEIPLLLGNAGNALAARENIMGSFATGVLAVVVATPCTAPFMATAIGFALTQGALTIITIFASLGLGLAFPFLLISFSPSIIKLLPKPGAWMNIFKQIVAFPMYLSCVWLIWVLMHETSADKAALVMLALVGITFALFLLRAISFFIRLIAMLIFAAALFMAFHSVGSPVTKEAEAFSISKLAALRAEGKAVFVDVTADWCITCKVNERVALSSEAIKAHFEEKHITYLVADWTSNNMDITNYLKSFGRAGVPLYVYYPASSKEPVLLPQILTESVVLDTVK